MKKNLLVLLVTVIAGTLISCGGKPGGLRSFEEIVPEFTKRLNKSLETATYNELVDLFDKKCYIIVNTEFHPENFTGRDGARTYFSTLPLEVEFEIGEIVMDGLRAETDYTYNHPDEGLRKGVWQFKLNNMGKISEFTVTPGD